MFARIEINKKAHKARAALIYDCDDVLSNSRGSNPTEQSPYIIDKDGNMDGNIIAIEKLKKVVRFCIEHDIPIYVITARPDREWHRNFIIKLINEVQGFHEGIGGFKLKTIHCIGLEAFSEELQRPHVAALTIESKQVLIKEIHEKELSHLPRSHILFVDDSQRNIDPVKAAGYSTIIAHVGKDDHHDEAYNFLSAITKMPSITTQGNYEVLVKPEQLPQLALDRTEFIEPSESEELKGYYWRKRMMPNLSALAEIALKDPTQREKMAADLTHLKSRQAIFFTNNLDLIIKQIMENSYGTVQSIEDLVSKKIIVLVGSEGRRKINPLKRALPDANIDLKEVAIIGLPADSGVSCQPVGHEEILLGCKNRLNQVICFKQGLNILLNKINGKRQRTIISITIENGIGLFPVESVGHDGLIQLASTPLLSNKGAQFHFYDQAHLLYHGEGTTSHHVAKPAQLEYTLTSDKLEHLIAYFKDGKPTDLYYLKQSEWSWEMLARRNSAKPESALPFRHEGDKIISSDILIQEALCDFFKSNGFKRLLDNVKERIGFFDGHPAPQDRSAESQSSLVATLQ